MPRRSPRCQVLLSAALAALIANSCATRPDWREITATNRFSQDWVAGRGYTHLVLANDRPLSGDRLHIYIEGDGTPWRSRTEIADDPTPEDPVMLAAMARDRTAAVYLGRPCYFGRSVDPGCGPRAWTFDRFSDATVQSMCAVAERVARARAANEISLFGHSGGGTIAVLMQESLPEADIVVTIGAPLDIDAWADLHRYTRLHGSLNPARRPLRRQADELHLLGSADRVAPPAVSERYYASRPWARSILVRDAGHTECWLDMWPEILAMAAQLAAGDAPRTPPRCP